MTNSRFWHAPVTPTWFELTVSTKAQARKKTKLTFLSYILRNFKRESKSNFPVTCADARILPKPARFEWTFWDDGETEKRGARSGEFRGTRYQTRQHTTRYPSAHIFTHIKNVVFLGRNIEFNELWYVVKNAWMPTKSSRMMLHLFKLYLG